MLVLKSHRLSDLGIGSRFIRRCRRYLRL